MPVTPAACHRDQPAGRVPAGRVSAGLPAAACGSSAAACSPASTSSPSRSGNETGDELLARVREAAEVPAYTYAGGDSGDDHMGWEMLAARFAGLDAWMCSHD